MKKLITILFLGFDLTAFAQDSTNIFDYNYRKGNEHCAKARREWGNNKKPSQSAVEEFKLSIPFFEKAHQINPNSISESFLQAYAVTGEKKKYEDLKKEFSTLHKK